MLKQNILHDYLTLCKPKVVLLLLITAWVGMVMAIPPNNVIPWQTLIFASCGIAFAASAAAVINHLLDRHIDQKMSRTALRPLASGRIEPWQAIFFAIVLGGSALLILNNFVNRITTILTFCSLFGYAGIYTIYLKRATPQNIVIGGLSGAMPPLLGWAAVSGEINPHSLLLVLIIFTWTPPHFWALAIYRVKDYTSAKIPMLPVTHGILFSKQCIVLYVLLLFAVTSLPFVVQMSGKFYFCVACILNLMFLHFAISLYKAKGFVEHYLAIKTFNFSILYLFVLCMALIIDHQLGTKL